MELKRTDYLNAVWEITQKLQNDTQLENALSECLGIIVDTVRSEEGSIWMLDRDDNRLYALMNVGKTDITGYSVAVGQGVAGAVAETGESSIVADTSKDERFTKAIDSETGFVTRSLIAVPLKNRYGVIGVLQMVNKKDGLFDADDLALAEELASLVAIAIDDKGYVYKPGTKRTPLISLRNIVKEFPSGDGVLRVLKGVNLDIYKNEFLVILGESGCGKSTLLNIVGGMEGPTDGSMTVDGKEFTHPSEEELTLYRRDYVGFIFQSYNLMPNLTALENVEFIAEICEHPKNPADMIELVGLSDRSGNYPAMMSGGQQQRVSIARALVKDPTVILADEPTAALDFTTGQGVLRIIEDVVKNHNATVVMVTHNVEIAKMADRVIRMKDGNIYNIRVNLHPLSADDLSW